MPPHYQDDSIIIHKYECGDFGNNAYLVVCPKTNESIIIDTPGDPGKVIEAAKSTDVKAIIITHNHWDHLVGFDEVTGAIDAPVGIGADDADALSRPPERLLRDGDEVVAGTVTLRAIGTPGHTPGSTCYTVGNALFSGDTLFPGGPGKSGSPDKLRQLIESITTKLLVLGDDVALYPGHGPDGDLKTSKEEYAVFASREHPADLAGDVLWLST